MIQKLRTYLIRWTNWLEDSDELRFIRSILRSNEDIELSRIYQEMSRLNKAIRVYIDKLVNLNSEYEVLINQAYSAIRRKKKFLKIPDSNQDEIIGGELSIANTQDAVIVATRLEKLLDQAKKKPNSKTIQELITIESDTLLRLVLTLHRDIPTVENTIAKVKRGKV